MPFLPPNQQHQSTEQGCKVLWWVCLFVCLCIWASVCLSVHLHNSKTALLNFMKFFVHVACGHDVIFSYHWSGRETGLTSVAASSIEIGLTPVASKYGSEGNVSIYCRLVCLAIALSRPTVIWCPFSRSLSAPQWIWNHASASVSQDLIRQLHGPVVSLLSFLVEAWVEHLQMLCTVRGNQRSGPLQVVSAAHCYIHNLFIHISTARTIIATIFWVVRLAFMVPPSVLSSTYSSYWLNSYWR